MILLKIFAILLQYSLLECNVWATSEDLYTSYCSQSEFVVQVISDQAVSSSQCHIQNLTCTSLQAAITFLSENKGYENSTICIQNSSTQLISSKVLFQNVSLRVVSKEYVLLDCVYDSNLVEDVANGTDYTWYFNDSFMMLLVNVHFGNCPYPIRIAGVQNVRIQDSSFKNFSEAVLDILNCESVTLNRVLLQDNVGTGTFMQSFRGNTGALSLSYQNYPTAFHPPNIKLCNCQFINNRADATENLLSTNEALSRNIFTGRGGSIGIFINEHRNDVSVHIEDSAIVDSYARSLGGGVFMIINGRLPTQHIVNFIRTNISSSNALVAGSGVFLGYLSATDTVLTPHSVVFKQCNFVNNTGFSGGGVYIVTSFLDSRGNYFRFDGCTFSGNRGVGSPDEIGAAISVVLFSIFEQRVSAVRHDIVNCTFAFNSGGNGIVSIGYAPIKFSGRNVFIGNNGAALRIIGSLVDFDGELTFINNTAPNEGALSLLSFGQIRAHRGLSLNFIGNKGRVGSSIVVSSPPSLLGFTKLIGNPQCFILYENSSIVPSQWDNVRINVDQNSALLGSALYLPQLGPCSWTANMPPYFDDFSIREWPAWNFGNNINTGYVDPNNSEYYIGSSARKILVRNTLVEAWPGKQFPMSVVGVDEFQHFTSTNAQFLQGNYSSKNDLLTIAPGIAVIAGSFGTGLLTDEFKMKYYVSDENYFLQPATTVEIEEPFETAPISAGNFTVIPQTCPGGYHLTEQREFAGSGQGVDMTCECLERTEVIACEEDQDSIIVKDGYWVGYVLTQTPNLFFYPCPPQYCRCTHNSSVGPDRCVFRYTQSVPDLQCNSQREGLLCGSCRNNTGVSVLLNNCVSCSNGFICLIVALVVLDMAVFVFITLVDWPITEWLYPFIFYVQVIPFVSRYFPESFETLGVYLTYVQSAVGFYFVYDFCLLENLPPLASYALRYLPFFTALVAISSVIIIRKLLRIKSLKYHGFWLILLLLYPQLVNTSLTLLNCPELINSSGSIKTRWFIDPSVQCFVGWHIPLFLFAIFILSLCCISVVVLLIFIYKKPKFSEDIIASMVKPLNESTQWWAAIELGRRLLLPLLVVVFPLNTVYVVLLLITVLSTTSFFLPYKSFLSNSVEIILLINVTVLMLLDATPSIREALFTFSEKSDVSPISWLLFSVYYLPILLFIAILVGDIAHRIARKLNSAADSRDKDKESIPSKRQVVQPPATTLVVVITDSDNQDEGEGTVLESSINVVL